MLAFLGPIFSWFENNKYAQWIVVALAAFAGWEVVKRNIHESGKREQRAEDAVATRNTLSTIEDKSNDRIAQADAIRGANPVTGNPERMSEPGSLPDYNYRS